MPAKEKPAGPTAGFVEGRAGATTEEVLDPLDPANAVFLQKLEKTIEAGLKTFVEVGHALAQIRTLRLYRSTHTTFESYCNDRWHFTRQRAHQLIGGAEVAKLLCQPAVDISEKTLRPLVSMSPEKRRETWEKAEAMAGSGRVSAKHVAEALKPKATKPMWTPPDPPKRRPIGPPSDGKQFSRMALMDLEQIRPDDAERDEAFEEVLAWISKHHRRTQKASHYEEALEQAREWMVRWSHLNALATVFDAITAAIEDARKGRS